MSNTMKTLHRKRGNLKHRLGSLETFYNEISGFVTGQLTTESIAVINSRLDSSVEIFTCFKEIQNEIEEICDDANLEMEYKERDEFETRFHKIEAKIKDLIIEQELSDSTNQVNSQASEQVSVQNISNYDSQIKLPIISLPKFNGSHTDWLEFKELFESMIHTNTHIMNVQKFHYLRACLTGNAAKAILKPNISSENYESVWDMLCKRYENKELLIHEHIKAIFELQSTSTNDSKGFRNIVDELNKHLKYLEKLGDEVQQRDALIIYIVTNKLDKNSLKEWEEYLKKNEQSSLDNLEKFLLDKAEIFEKLEQRTNKVASSSNSSHYKHQGFLSTQTTVICELCKKDHNIYKCHEFLSSTPQQRFEKVKSLKLCINCLRIGHINQGCHSGNCKKCQKPHNTLLHFEQAKRAENNEKQVAPDTISQVSTQNVFSTQSKFNTCVLLSTVCFSVIGKDGNKFECRALLDNGSQSNFITKSFFEKLELEKKPVNMSVVGVGNVSSNINYRCSLQIQSHDKQFKTNLNCFLINQIRDNIPNFEIDYNDIHIPKNIKLADPDFYDSASIDILIGAELFWKLLKVERIELEKNLPLLQNSVFGWIVTGVFNSLNNKPAMSCNLSVQTIHEDMQKFWLVEENYNSKSVLTAEEQECEFIFQRDYKRKPNGQFVVSIPFEKSPEILGNSVGHALQRFKSTEYKLLNDHSLKEQYIEFMTEYQKLGHMSKLSKPVSDTLCYYLPHHAIIKTDSLTTKCRVVFDGSAATDNSLSLNNIQYTGSIQDDLLAILIRFREHAIVFTADICKMYRQIEVIPEHRKHQRIFWRENSSQCIESFELNTVTYGTASAPFLATRCIKQLAKDTKKEHPLASEIISRDFYIDDLISGSDTTENAIKLIKQLIHILNSGCFTLTKWCSNDSTILASVNTAHRLTHYNDVGEKTDTKLIIGTLSNVHKIFTSGIMVFTNTNNWFHVKTHENPADLVSRGMQMSELQESKIWWEGPNWLFQANDNWKYSIELISTDDLPETKVQVNTVIIEHNSENFISKFSSLTRLKHAVAYWIRFKQNASPNTTTRKNHKTLVLTVDELENAFRVIIRMSQKNYFQLEIDILKKENNLPKNNKLKQFHPFLDSHGILRVGGRIQNAKLQFDQTHPIILDSKSHLSMLFLTFEHLRNYHAGPQHLLYLSRQKFWIVGGRSLAKQIVRKCIPCFRAKPKTITPVMGNLPPARVQLNYPFTHTGTDFAGPFLVRERKGRGIKKFKCYLCVFVCMSTKAIHLEVLTDLTTDSFFQSFRRFIARRGHPTNAYLDNGKTFIKANKDLLDLGKFLQNYQNSLIEKMNDHSIKWHFIPAYSPNFGGLWEAGVKSTKGHLKRVLANASVTLMEFVTIVTEIEGILNSRPIAPMSNDPTDLEPLSPGHFLIGRPMTSIVEPDITEIQPARLSSYKRLEQLRQHFWNRWYKEYITELQLRHKWKDNVNDVQLGSLVLIKDNHLPPLCWRLGRITEVHPGSDGVVRVVTIKTSTSVIKRATTQVCVLPVET